MIKTLKKTRNRQTYSQHYTKCRTIETIPTKIRNETGKTSFPTLTQYSLRIPSQRNKTTSRNNKKYSNRKGWNQTILFAVNMNLYIKDLENSTKKYWNHKLLWQVTGYKINMQNSVYQQWTDKIESRKTTPFTKASKIK
jgi:hypothetical protein